MLTLILLASIGQVYEKDFYFEMAVENFVIDNAKPPIRYSTFLPKDLTEYVNMWDEDCPRCRRTATEKVVAMGPGVIRFLFYPLRAKSPSVSMHAEAVINRLISCGWCKGAGICPGYIASEKLPGACGVCHSGASWHNLIDNTCFHCNGRGVFEVDDRPYVSWSIPE